MWGVQLSSSTPFVYALFGLQLPNSSPTPQQSALVTQLTDLLSTHPAHIDHLVQEGCASPSNPQGKTRIWLTYWRSSHDYQTWWTSPAVVQFWSNLPDDAGLWREVMTLPGKRTQHGTNMPSPLGLGHLGARVTNGDKIGYWGCYRHRLSATAEGDKMECPMSRNQNQRPSSSSHSSRNDRPFSSTAQEGKVRPGRVLITEVPDNLCFVVEGQDHSAITPSEKELWFNRFDPLVTGWIKDLVSSTSPPEELSSDSGLLSTRICYDPEGGTFRDDNNMPALNYNTKMQLFYFRDLGCLERMGRQNKGHVLLRKTFLGAYGPGGDMSEEGKLGLWVETSVVKAREMECEYVGCQEGTGLMGLAQ